MTNVSLFVPLIYNNVETEKQAVMIASHRTVSEDPLTDSTAFQLQINGRWFYFKTLKSLHLFEEKESAYILLSDHKRHPEMDAKELSKAFSECVREDPAWELSMMHAKDLPFFLETLAVPVSFGFLPHP